MNVRLGGLSVALCLLFVLQLANGQDIEDTEAFLDRCEAAGAEGAKSVSKAACAVLKSKCPPPEAESRSLFADTPDALFIEVVRETCDLLFTTTCKNMAVELLFEDPVCTSIITVGPGAGSEECPDFAAAEQIFLEEIEACDAEDLRDQIEKQEREGDTTVEETGDEKTVEEEKEVPDPTPSKEGEDALPLDTCEASGKVNGRSAAKKACGVVKAKCKTAAAGDPEARLLNEEITFDEKLLVELNRASCQTLYTTSCTNEATTAAFDDAECGALISEGPGDGSAKDCQDVEAAFKLFTDSLDICEKDPSQDVSTPQPEGQEKETQEGDETISLTPVVPAALEPDSETGSIGSEGTGDEVLDDPCECTSDGVIGGTRVPIKGCQGLCFVVGGKKCSDAKKSQNYEGIYWRLCK